MSKHDKQILKKYTYTKTKIYCKKYQTIPISKSSFHKNIKKVGQPIAVP